MKRKPNIKDYQNIALFLQHYYEYKKSLDSKFSYSSWAQKLGIKNRSYLRLILSGDRPINETLAKSLLSHLKLDDSEADYFTTLLGYNQSKHQAHKYIFGQKLLKFQNISQDFQEVQDHYTFLSNPLLPRLLTLLSFNDFSQNPAQAAFILGVTEQELQDGCQKLEALALIERSPQGDSFRWQTKKKSWRLPNNFKNLGFRDFYMNSLETASKAIDLYSEDERRFRSLFLALNPQEFQGFLKDFEDFIQAQIAKRDVPSIDGRRLYQLLFSFFPTSKNQE